MPDDDLPDRLSRFGGPTGGAPHPTGPPAGSPAGLSAAPTGQSGNAMETAWRRWREAVAVVHEGLDTEDLRPWELQELFDGERSARRVCAAVLRVAGRRVPEYLTDSATLSALWPEPERPG
jgi:hypothetical protein